MASILIDFLSQFVLDMMVRGTGFAILKVVFPRWRPGETSAELVGLAFWLVLALFTALIIWGILIA